MKNNPLVSVYVPTYYHEKYLSKALESIISQKCNFEYEILISDDGSKDKTIDVIERYARKYPYIKYNINEENLGLTRNVYLVKSMCSGKYIVGLSGDDYWIDKNKLQKQVDFMEQHQEYIAVGTRIEGRFDDDNFGSVEYPDVKWINKEFTLSDFLKGNNTPLNGLLMKNVIKDPALSSVFSMMPKLSHDIDDLTDNLFLLMFGNIFILSDITVAYRMRKKTKDDHNFNSIYKGFLGVKKHILLLNNIEKYLRGKLDLTYRYRNVLFDGLVIMFKNFDYRGFKQVYRLIPIRYRRFGRLFFLCILFFPHKVKDKLKRAKRIR